MERGTVGRGRRRLRAVGAARPPPLRGPQKVRGAAPQGWALPGRGVRKCRGLRRRARYFLGEATESVGGCAAGLGTSWARRQKVSGAAPQGWALPGRGVRKFGGLRRRGGHFLVGSTEKWWGLRRRVGRFLGEASESLGGCVAGVGTSWSGAQKVVGSASQGWALPGRKYRKWWGLRRRGRRFLGGSTESGGVCGADPPIAHPTVTGSASTSAMPSVVTSARQAISSMPSATASRRAAP